MPVEVLLRQQARQPQLSEAKVALWRRIGRYAAIVQVGCATALLAAWLWGQTWLTDLALNSFSMRATGAVALILLGSAIVLRALDRPTAVQHRVATLLALLAALVGLLTLFEYATDTSVGIDELFVADHLNAEHPGRISIPAASLLVLLGVAVASIDWRASSSRWPAGFLVLAAGVVAEIALLGHIYAVPSLYEVGSESAMAYSAALSFMCLAFAVSCARPRYGLLALLLGSDAGSRISRVLIPAAVLTPAIVGAGLLAAERAGAIGVTVMIWLFAISIMVIGVLLVMRASTSVSRLDAERRRDQLAVQASAEQLGAILDTAEDAFVQADSTRTVTGWNRKAQDLIGWSSEEALGSDLAELLIPERHRELFIRNFRLAQRHRNPLANRYETKVMLRDGQELLMEFSFSMMGEGESFRFNVFGHDISARKKAERELEKSRRTLRGFLDNAPLSIYMKDRLGRFILVSREFERAMGVQEAELVGKSSFEVWPDSAASQPEVDRQVLTTGMPRASEEKVVLPDGSEHALLSVKFPLLDEDGIAYAVCGVSTDITEQKKMAEDLRSAEKRYRSLVEQLPVVTYVESAGDDKLIYISPQIEELSGYAPQQWIDDPSLFERLLHPDDRDRVMGTFRKSKTSGKPFKLEYRMIARDGRTVWVREQGAYEYDLHGRAQTLRGFCEDVTEAKSAELELRTSRDQLGTAVETMSDGLVFVDAAGEPMLWNSAADKIVGANLNEAGHVRPETWPEHFGVFEETADGLEHAKATPLARALTGEHVNHADLFVRNVNNPEGIWVTVSASPLTLHDGSPGGAVAVFRDATDRKRVEQEQAELRERLVQAERLETVGKLAGGIAHDFNNLLAVIMTYAGFVSKEVSGRPAEDVEQIQLASQRASELTRRLLTFGRREPRNPCLLDINGLVRESERLLQPLLGDDVALELDLSPEPVPVNADPAQLEQVLLNLATNARDAMPTGGRVRIESETVPIESGDKLAAAGLEPGLHARLVFADSGSGMEEEVAEHAFEPFFTTKDVGSGTGLGLATVYGVVTQSGGHVVLESAPGRGTEMAIYLPLANGSVLASTAAPSPPIQQGHGETVLVVEDERPVREAAIRILSEHGYSVLDAPDGEGAIQIIGTQESGIDLLLTDVRMYPMSGTEVAERAQKLVPGMPVLFMTGYTERPPDGGAPVLSKPFDAQRLLQLVQETLEGSVDRDDARKEDREAV